MFRRFLLLLLIALLPLQGIAASFMAKCPEMATGSPLLAADSSLQTVAGTGSELPCHEHSDDSVAGNASDPACCHQLAVAIPQDFLLPAATNAHEQAYPVMVSSFTDHFPDRLQRPPLALVI